MINWTSNDQVKLEYSLTKHLNILCNQDEKYKDLYAVWTLDQEIYSKALTNVALSFPHYSMHDASHSSSIINKIEMILGEERIKSMSPTDTFMILESAYLHDFGMIVANSELIEEWGKSRFQRFLKHLKESTYDEEIAEAANYLLSIQDEKISFKDNIKWPVKIKNCVTIISAEYFRKKHSFRSAKWIEDPEKLGIDINFNKLIPERIMSLIGKVAISHGTDFESVVSSLEQTGNGIGTDRVHPRFIACLLRLGDLLDLDNGRFNIVTENVSKFPKSSENHKEKHASITHFLVCPQKIEVSAVCKDDKVYRVTREWFDYLKEELKNLSSRWSEIVPHDFQGGPPSLGDLKLSIENAQQITEQLDLRFSINQERAFELIEGSGIYDSELIFIRELIQNALDATKIQVWKDIKSKKYDGIKIGSKTIDNISENKEKLIFYDDIDKEIRNLYPINIEVIYKEPEKSDNCEHEKEAEYIFKIEDRGCGMSIEDLKRIENVGGSWEQDDDLADFRDDMPEFLKPTGSFGLGLHSVFMITDKMKIKTKSEEDKAFDISFVSRRKNGYISVEENKDRKSIGTEISISIKESKLEEAINNYERTYDTEDMLEEFKEYDSLSERYNVDTNLRYLAAYINEYIKNINMFNIGCMLEKKDIDEFKISKEKHISEDSTNDNSDEDIITIIEKNDDYNEEGLNYRSYLDRYGLLKIIVRDKKNSAILIFSVKKYCIVRQKDEYYIYRRVVGEIDMYFKEIQCKYLINNKYFNVELNIFKGQAKEVLDVARNDIKPLIKEHYIERINYVIRDYLKYTDKKIDYNSINRQIRDKVDSREKNFLNYYELSMFILRLAYNHYLDEPLPYDWGNNFIIDDYYMLDKDIINKLSLANTTYKEFIDSNKIILTRFFYPKTKKILDWNKKNNINGIIANRGLHFEDEYIKENFKINQYASIDDIFLLILEKDNEPSKCFMVERNTKVYKDIVRNLISENIVRSAIYPIGYKDNPSVFECLVINESPKNLNISEDLIFDKYFIISPLVNTIKNYKGIDVDSLIKRLKKEANFDNLVRFVVMNSVKNKDKNIKETEVESHKDFIEEVEKAYKQLIQDYLDLINLDKNSDSGDNGISNTGSKAEDETIKEVAAVNAEELNDSK